ncbi:MAG: EAL domain-containing protein [Oceanospirillaceae bacterium]
MILALIIVGLSIWNSVYLKSRSDLSPHANSLTEAMSRFLTFQDEVLLTTAEKFDMTSVTSLHSQGVISELFRVSKQMKAVAILDVDNKVVISEGGYEGEWVRLFSSKTVNLSSVGLPFRMSSFGEHYLPLRVPIFNEYNVVMGYLVAAYQIIGPDGVWDKAAVSIDNAKVLLSNDRGYIYASYPEKKSFLQSFGTARIAPDLRTKLALIDEDLVGLGSASTAEGGIFFSAKKVPNFNGYVVVTIEYNKLWVAWFTRMQFATLVVLAVALLGLLVLRISIRRAYLFEEEKFVAQHRVSKLSHAIEQSPSSVIVTNDRWVTEYANRKLLDGTGQIIEIAPNTVLVDSKPHNLLKADLEKILVTLNLGENWYCERCDEAQQQWFSFAISKMTLEDDQDDSFIIITQNITDRKKAEARLYKQAYYDSLTDLPNRRNSSLLLQKELVEARKNDTKVALIYLDLDNFKSVNDRFGHAIGDQLLQAVARRLGKAMHQKGTACHMSGDEFLAFLPYEDKAEIVLLIDDAIEVITQPIILEGKELFVTVSMGISRFPLDCSDESTMLKNADIALYFSKDSGRNCYSFFDEELEKKSQRKLELETEIRTALQNNELFMVYQTKNKISDYTVCSFEALMRWQSPKLGFVGPDEFIGAAESVGAIQKMGEFALYQACKDLKRFQKESDQPLTMAVNLSMRQLNNDDIVGIVKKVLETEDISPASLELEITETLLAERFDIVLPILNKLLALGVSLSIDDFGTGYSSLNYLTRFPVDTLKVDRCFITGIVNAAKDAALTESVISMAHRLGMKVVAEGIEDLDQIEVLQKFGCDVGQGYFYTKPIKADEMITLLQNQLEIISKILSIASVQPVDLIDDIEEVEVEVEVATTAPITTGLQLE